MTFEVKYCKTAYISETINMYGKLPEEINERGSAVWKRITKDKGRQNDRKKLANEDHYLHIEKFPKFLMYLQ